MHISLGLGIFGLYFVSKAYTIILISQAKGKRTWNHFLKSKYKEIPFIVDAQDMVNAGWKRLQKVI